MKKQTQSFIRFLAIPCLLSTLSLSADDMDSSDMGQGQKAPSTENFMSTYDRLKGKEITPNAGPVVSGGVDAYFEADYIYWYVNQEGLDYSFSGLDLGSPTSNNYVQPGVVRTPSGSASSGFKVGAGLDFDYDGWDLGLTYTWLRNSGHSSFGPDVDYQSVGLMNNVVDSGVLIEGGADYRLRFNVFDLELGRSFFISPKLVLRPHLGLKGTWQNSIFNLGYLFEGQYEAHASANETYSSQNEQYYWGLGTRVGLDSSWLITKSFSLFGECAFSNLWGCFKDTRHDDSDIFSTPGDASVNADALIDHYTAVELHQRRHKVNPVLEAQIGFRYDYMFSDDEYRFRIQAGWETQVWFDQNNFLTNDYAQAGGNLTLQGLTLNFRFDF